jgi:transcriptional regulator with XRE-family HTH domain
MPAATPMFDVLPAPTPAELIQVRKALGLTQKSMASFFCVDAVTYRRWEAGTQAIHPLVTRILYWLSVDGYRPPELVAVAGIERLQDAFEAA